MIENNKLFFRTYDAFNAALQNNQIKNDAIAFIKDIGKIWTHGTFFGGSDSVNTELEERVDAIDALLRNNDGIKHVILSQSQYDLLSSYDNNTIYFIIDQEWVLGDALPLILCEEHTELGQALPIVLSYGIHKELGQALPIVLSEEQD